MAASGVSRDALLDRLDHGRVSWNVLSGISAQSSRLVTGLTFRLEDGQETSFENVTVFAVSAATETLGRASKVPTARALTPKSSS